MRGYRHRHTACSWATTPATGQRYRTATGSLCTLLGGLVLLVSLWPTAAQADCTFDNYGTQKKPKYYTSAPVNFTVTSPITIPFALPSFGAALSSPVSAAPANPAWVTCDPSTSYGVVNLIGSTATVGGNNYIFPTSVSGVGYQLVHANNPSVFMSEYPNNTTGGGDTIYSVATTFQLVQIGPIATGSVLPAGTFANWQWGSIVPEYFVLSNPVTFVASACTWQDVNVTLPTLSRQTFPIKDSTAGVTAFSIPLDCPTGSTSNLSVTIAASSGVVIGYNNVLQSTGTATGVGVELLDQNSNSVVFGTTMPTGITPTGAGSLSYYARYHSTANVVTAGTVQATATFTLTYN